MPAAIEAPPSGAPEGVNIVEGAPPKPPPAPTTMIRASDMPATAGVTMRGPGKAFNKLQSDLRKKAGVTEPQDPPAQQPPSAPDKSPSPPEKGANESEPASTSPETGSTPKEGEQTTPPATEITPPTAKTDKGSKNPWKVVDDYKARLTKAETEVAELRKQIVPEQDRKSYDERLKATEARNNELEEEIRFHNYKKSKQFQDEYQKPYEDAFRRALTDLSEVTVQDLETGQMRNLSKEDLAEFAMMSFVQAKEKAHRLYPDFAEDIMSARRELRGHLDRQQQALNEWKEKGSKVQQEREQAAQRQAAEVSQHIQETWKKVNAQALEDPQNGEYFKPKEGNEDWNQRLAKGFELVDRAYSENPADPRLSPEQRASVIKRHAAVRNRAASWGALKAENVTLRAELAEFKKKLAGYQASTPPAGGTMPNGTPSEPARATDQMKAALRKLAHVA